MGEVGLGRGGEGAAAGVKGKKHKWVYDTSLGTGGRYGQGSQVGKGMRPRLAGQCWVLMDSIERGRR
jgi:hypothetical protein